jgi:hypothetical protein
VCRAGDCAALRCAVLWSVLLPDPCVPCRAAQRSSAAGIGALESKEPQESPVMVKVM